MRPDLVRSTDCPAGPTTRAIEVFALHGDRYEQIVPLNGVIHALALGIELLVAPGTLRIRDGAHVADV